MAFYQASGRTNYYFSHGEGRPVLLLHGISNSGRAWGPQVATLVATGRRVVVPDLAGHGASASVTAPMDISAIARDVEDLIKQLDIADLDVVGLSMGGMVAMQLACNRRCSIGRLVVANSFPSTVSPAFRDMAEGWAQTFEQLHGPVLRLEQSWPSLVSPAFQETPEGLQTYQVWHGIAATANGASLAHVARGITTFDMTGRLSDLTMPTLFIAGGLDRMSPPELSRQMADATGHGRCACIPAAGHISNVDSADAFSELLLQFLSSTSQ